MEAVPEAERMPLEEPAIPLPAMTMAEMAPAPTAALPVEAEPLVPAHHSDGEQAPTWNGNGRKSELVFGLTDHILLARRRRSQPRNTLPHQKNRTEVLSIPATSETGEPVLATCDIRPPKEPLENIQPDCLLLAD